MDRLSDDPRNHRLLNHDQEIALSRRIRCGDAEALDEMVRHNLRLVYKVAQRYYTNDPGTEFDDLVQHGMIGLLAAARRYDPDRGTRFSTFATWWVRQSVQRAAITAGTIPRQANPDYQPVKPGAIRAKAIRQAPIGRLDAPLRDRRGDDSNSTLNDILADQADSVEDQVLSNMEVERIITTLNLTERGEATVRDWLPGYSREEAGKRHGLSRSWIDTRLRVSNAYHFKDKIMPTHKSTTCTEPGCDQPKYVNPSGTTFARCEQHQKAFWNAAAKARRVADRDHHVAPKPKFIKPVLPPPVPVEAQHDEPFVPPHEESSGQSSDGCTCAKCIYRQAIDVLAAKVPGVRELVDALQTIENGRR